MIWVKKSCSFCLCLEKNIYLVLQGNNTHSQERMVCSIPFRTCREGHKGQRICLAKPLSPLVYLWKHAFSHTDTRVWCCTFRSSQITVLGELNGRKTWGISAITYIALHKYLTYVSTIIYILIALWWSGPVNMAVLCVIHVTPSIKSLSCPTVPKIVGLMNLLNYITCILFITNYSTPHPRWYSVWRHSGLVSPETKVIARLKDVADDIIRAYIRRS